MGLVSIDVFRGEVPKLKPRHLGLGYAQTAYNCKLFDGKLKPWWGLKDIFTLTKSGEIQSIYPLKDGSTYYWNHWTQIVDALPLPVASDTTQRFAFTGYGAPKESNFALATTGTGTNYPLGYWRLGVPAPITAPGIASVTGAGTGVVRDRAYICTFVHVWADGKTEESAPSPASALTAVQAGQTVNLNALPRWIITPTSITRSGSTATVTIPAGYTNWFGDKDRPTIAGAAETEYNGTFEITRVSDTVFTYPVTGAPATPATGTITVKSDHNITKKRIYRTVIGNSGTFYRFVTEQNESVTTYADAADDTTIALNGVSPTIDLRTLITWDMPPLDLHSIVSLPNGFMAGLSGNQVCFCVPYFTHAWPVGYRLTMPFNGVALGVVGNTLVVATESYPVTYTGTHPSAMVETRLQKVNHAGRSKRSMVSTGHGVYYSATEGLVMIAPGGTNVEVVQFWDKESWTLFYPTTLRSLQFNDRYFGAYYSGDSGGVHQGGGFILDRSSEVGGLGTFNYYIAGGHFEIATGKLFLIVDGKVKEFDGDQSNRSQFYWRSGKFILPRPSNLGVARVEAEFQYSQAEVDAINTARAAGIAANQGLLNDDDLIGPLNTMMLNDYGSLGGLNDLDDGFTAVPDALNQPSLTFQIYQKGVLRATKQVTSDRPFRLPSGFKYDDLELVLFGNGVVHRVQAGNAMKDLATK